MKLLKSEILRKKIIIFMCDFLFAFLAYYMLFDRSLTTDGLSAYRYGTMIQWDKSGFFSSMSGGRPVSWIITGILYFFKYDLLYDQWISQLIKELICAGIVTMFVFYFCDDVTDNRKLFVANTIFLISTVNVYSEEQFVFNTVETGIGWLLVCIAGIMFLKRKYVLSVLLAFWGTGIYQTYIFIFYAVVVGGLLINSRCKVNKELIKRIIGLFVICIVVAGFYVYIPSISVRLGLTDNVVKDLAGTSGYDIGHRVKVFYDSVIRTLYSTNGMTVPLIIFGELVITITLMFINMHKTKNSIGEKIVVCVLFFSLFFSTFAILFVVGVAFELPPREMISYFYDVSFFVYAVYMCTDEVKNKKIIEYCSIVVLFFVFIGTFLSGVDHKTADNISLIYVEQIQNRIEEYERQSGEKIDCIYYVSDEELRRTDIFEEYMILDYLGTRYNCSLLCNDWGCSNALRFVSGRDYERRFLTLEEYDAIFPQRQWEEFDVEKQLVFDGNVMYWAVY